MPSLQDFSLIRTHVERYIDEEQAPKLSLAFYLFVAETVLGISESEADECITDNHYLQIQGSGNQGHDMGIDIVYVDSDKNPPVIHLINCKYTEKFDKTSNHFPGNEIDKLSAFLNHLMSRDKSIKEHVNPVLYSKMEEIWDVFDKQSPRFVIHLCSNLYNEFQESDNRRFLSVLNAYSNISVEHHTITRFVGHLVSKEQVSVNSKIKGIDRNFFEKSDGDVRALVVNIDVRDLLKLVSSDKEFRENPNVSDYSKLLNTQILEDAFEDNVRVYLDQKTKINQTIKQTALSEERFHFFYFNNGITITCKKFEYPKGLRAPVIELNNLQVVNGSQTIHSLHEAYQEDPDAFLDMDILCRIYETNNNELSQDISEYTNSQNPVKSRDVRSNDYFQKKLELEMAVLGYYYERKKNQHREQSRNKRIDSEVVGQALFAFHNQEPGLAKDKKKEVFGDYYEEIFNDDVTSDLCLTAYFLLKKIESKRREFRKILINDYNANKDYEFLLHSTLYLLYVINVAAVSKEVEISFNNITKIYDLYDYAKELIKQAVNEEIQRLGKELNLRVFFKGTKAKKVLESVFDIEGLSYE